MEVAAPPLLSRPEARIRKNRRILFLLIRSLQIIPPQIDPDSVRG